MPYLKIQTNVKIEDKDHWMSEATSLLSNILGKPDRYIMIATEDKANMMFAGSTDALAFVELKSIGLPEDETKELSGRICNFIEETLRIDPSRIYIEFANAQRHMFGWNGSTFG